jgi:hypothetical protein
MPAISKCSSIKFLWTANKCYALSLPLSGTASAARTLGVIIMRYVIIILFFLISCHEVRHERNLEKARMYIAVKIKCEGYNSYTIAWYDTLGKYQNLNKYNRPFHIVCEILDQHDTVGSYHGLSNPSTWTSYGTKDTIISVYFSITRNTFSEMPPKQQMDYPDISCNFLPVQLNTKSHLEERINLILIQK